MNRKGDTWSMVFAIALGLIVVAISVFVLKDKITLLAKSDNCTGKCISNSQMSSCAQGSTTAKGCPSGQFCCLSASSDVSGGDANNPDLNPGASLVQLPYGSISINYGSTQNPSSLTLLSGASQDPIIATIKTPYYVDYDPKATSGSSSIVRSACKNPASDTIICSPNKWNIFVSLETDTKRVIESQSFLYEPNGNIHLVAQKSPTKFMTVSSSGYIGDQRYQNYNYINQSINLVSINFNDNFYANYSSQTVYVVISIYATNKALQTQQRIAVKSAYPVSIDMIDAWSKQKDIKINCNKNLGVKCSTVALKIVDSNGTCASDPGTLSAVPLRIISTNYRMIDPSGKPVGSAYATVTDCQNALESNFTMSQSGISTNMLQMAQQIAGKANLSTTDQNTLAMLMQKAESGASVSCVSQQDVVDSALKFDTAYPAETFNIDSQSGTATLAQASMSGRYLCAYGQEAGTGKWFSSGNARKITIDRTAPVVNATFHPLSKTITVTCKDGNNATDIQSGCKPNFGYAYIADPTKFLSSLFASQQSATKWCPTSGYTSETRTTIVYPNNGVQVLCVKWDDKVGNSGQSMVTVYDPYSLAAGVLAIQQKK